MQQFFQMSWAETSFDQGGLRIWEGGEGAGEARGAGSVSLEEELASDCVLL